jgi:hypothetical protein
MGATCARNWRRSSLFPMALIVAATALPDIGNIHRTPNLYQNLRVFLRIDASYDWV